MFVRGSLRGPLSLPVRQLCACTWPVDILFILELVERRAYERKKEKKTTKTKQQFSAEKPMAIYTSEMCWLAIKLGKCGS